MPRTRSLAWAELKIGLLTIVAIIIAATLVVSLTGSKGFFWQRYMLKTRFPSVAGLASGSPVRVAGRLVGTVRSIDFSGDQLDITFDVNKEVRDKITDRSTAFLGAVSLLGESAVDITPSTAGTPIPEGGYVPLGHSKGQISDIAEQAGESIGEITKLVHDVRGGRGTVGKLMTDDDLYVELRHFVASADSVTQAIQQGRGTLGKLVNDPKAAAALEGSLKNIEAMTARINAGEGSLGKLLKDEAFAQSLSGATLNLKDLTDRLNRGEGTAGKLMTDPTLFNRLNEVTGRLDELVTKLNAGEGTAGQLLKDKQLYENMNKTVTEFQSLLTEIKKDPRKYLSVKVSIW
jgi:phospholipid/cholesterol/gamma-HCH transport system substrate-binding protein